MTDSQKERLNKVATGLRIARSWIPDYTAPAEEKDGFISDMKKVNEAMQIINEILGEDGE